MRSRVIMLLAGVTFILVTMASTTPAFAYNEGGSADPARTACSSCHGAVGPAKGPHGDYTAGTDKCQTCHAVHRAGSPLLLPKQTISGTCSTCHDGTGGGGVYGTLQARGLTPGGGHSIETTNVIPNGDPTGGPSTRTFGGVEGKLSCGDCHSPHDSDTVTAFQGDRVRTAGVGPAVSSKLLRQKPTGATYASAEYGSDWCGSCHSGAVNGTVGGHNHPAETSATANAYSYRNVPSLASTASVTTTLAPLGGSNLGYLMPDPRTPEQTGHAPLCQQCHEDSRALGTVGAAEPFKVSAPDGANESDQPRFQNFPHETANSGMLVESGDDLCTNCHTPSQLP